MNNSLEISENIITRLLFAVLFINLFLKLFGIWNVSSQDEYIEVIEALRLCSGHLNFERWIKRVYLYIIACEYGVYYIINFLLGYVHTPSDFAAQIVRDMQPLFIIARATSALFATATIWLTFKTGQLIHSSLSGLIACIFLTVTPVVLELSHYARVDATLSFLMLCSIFFIIKVFQNKQDKISDLIFAGLFSGLAFQCKPQGITLIIPFLVAFYFSCENKSIVKSIFNKKSGAYLSGFIAGWIIGNPAVLIGFPKYIASMTSMGKVYTTPLNIEYSKHIGYISYIYDFINQMGPILFILMSLSLFVTVMWIKKRNILF